MDVHIQRKHRDAYQKYYGVALAPRPSCGHCQSTFGTASEIADHELAAHGIEVPAKRTTMSVLTRMTIANLSDKLRDEARALNAVQQRIAAGEAALAERDPSYTSTHGLDVTTVWQEVGAKRPLKTISESVAEQLQETRIAAQEEGKLLDGSLGTYAQVAGEIEGLVLSLTGKLEENLVGEDQDVVMA